MHWISISFVGLLCSLLTVNYVQCQISDEDVSQDNFDKDNRFPADINEEDNVESSGNGANTIENETTTAVYFIEEPPLPVERSESESILCPDECTCTHEKLNEDTEFTVDCSSKSLTELPPGIDSRVTTLLLQKNLLETVPKDISEFKSLHTLNLNDNKITDFEFGSVSELPKLRALTVSNNRLLQVPRDLKNAFELHNLETLDLSGNDIRETIDGAFFSQLSQLKTLIIPKSTPKVISDLCQSNTEMQTICTESCEIDNTDCTSLSDEVTETIIDEPILSKEVVNDLDMDVTTENDLEADEKTETSEVDVPEMSITATVEKTILNKNIVDENFESTTTNEEVSTTSQPESNTESVDIKEAIIENASNVTESNVGAAKDKTIQQGGVDNRIIAGVIVGLVAIVAAVAIKKNWSSIRNKFRPRPVPNNSTPRGNGAVPEEMPLKNNSPA